jgi:V8-like Glu-specific endopeptidase
MSTWFLENSMITKYSLLRTACAVSVLALVSSLAMAAPPASKAPEHSNRSFDREAELAQRRELHSWLMSERVASGRNNPVNISVSAAERLEIDTARGESPERVGVTRAVDRHVAFGDVNLRSLRGRSQAMATGALVESQDGGYVYTAELGSPNATGIRVHFTGFRLADNAGLYLYTQGGQVFGPYTGRGPHGDGDFWSHTLVGDKVTLQLRHVGPASRADLAGTSFSISGLAHLRPRFLGGPCSYNAACVVNLACASGVSSAVDIAKDAVAHMQWISGPYVNFCSGGLVADTDSTSQIPYFLTANHCISRGKDARNLETFFKLAPAPGNTVDVDCQTGTCDDWRAHREDHPQSLRTLGARIQSSNRTSDYTLLELNEPAPAGTQFLGWDTAAVDGSNGADLYRISHPSGAPQSYSEHEVDTTAGTCTSWPRGDWIYSHDTYGATEGGSSGSPVVNAAGQVVGQLSGACGTNVNDTCDNISNATVDGAFAAYFGEVAVFLDPEPVQCTPEPEVCNGADDDCDGEVDEGDVCSGGGTGSSCDIDADCNSGRCKGKPGAKVCK